MNCLCEQSHKAYNGVTKIPVTFAQNALEKAHKMLLINSAVMENIRT